MKSYKNRIVSIKIGLFKPKNVQKDSHIDQYVAADSVIYRVIVCKWANAVYTDASSVVYFPQYLLHVGGGGDGFARERSVKTREMVSSEFVKIEF